MIERYITLNLNIPRKITDGKIKASTINVKSVMIFRIPSLSMSLPYEMQIASDQTTKPENNRSK